MATLYVTQPVKELVEELATLTRRLPSEAVAIAVEHELARVRQAELWPTQPQSKPEPSE